MKIFTDQAGRPWAVAVNCWTIKVVEGATGVHIPSLLDEGFAGLVRMLDDPSRLVIEVIWPLCRAEAEARKVTEEQFLASMHGDALQGAADAFQGALSDFFSHPGQREMMAKVFGKLNEMKEQAMGRGAELIEGLTLSLEADSMVVPPNGSPGSSRESSGSIPTPSRSASSA